MIIRKCEKMVFTDCVKSLTCHYSKTIPIPLFTGWDTIWVLDDNITIMLLNMSTADQTDNTKNLNVTAIIYLAALLIISNLKIITT